jgi:CRISP-associated protein Cas1
MPVMVVDDWGCFVGKSGEMIVIRKQGTVLAQRPFEDIEAINIEGRGISMSVDLIHECAVRGVPINCLAYDGRPYAKIISPMLTATVKTRRSQLYAFDDHRGVQIAAEIVSAKLANQRRTLLYFAKYRKQTDPELHQAMLDACRTIAALDARVGRIAADCIDDCRPDLLNLEGRAGAAYWEAVWQLAPDQAPEQKRVHRGATDMLNCMLNYGYGILQSQCWSAVMLAGLDPFGGFLHADRPGKPSLVLDLQEMFRQPVVDRTVLAMANRGFRADFEEPGRMEKSSRRELAAAVMQRLDTITPFAGRRLKLASLIVEQARALAVAVRGEKPFRAFRMRW